eukprot:1156686-Pelagomonas_calceolata.AAC.1
MEGNAMTCARQHVHDEIAITGARRHMHDGIASSKQNPTNLHMPRTTLPLKNVIHLRQLPSIGALRTALVVSCMPLYAVVSCMPTYCDSYRTVPSPVSHPNTAIKGSAGGRVVQACKHVQLAKHVGVHGGERVARACKHVHMADHVGVQAGE